jgi:hypothetical protein
MNSHSTDKLTLIMAQWAAKCLAVIFVLLPFHAFLTVALATATGHYDLLRLWKELILLALVPVGVVIIYRTPKLRQEFRRGWLFWCIASYTVLHVVLGAVALSKGQVNIYALGYALIINLRPLLIFCLAFVAGSRTPWLRDHWRPLLLWPAAVVIGFGLLQTFVLPANFLQHFGYNTATITPYETVDQKLSYIRIQSTLRGANPLGAYLVLALSGVMVLLLKSKFKGRGTDDQRQVIGITLLSAGLIVLVSTYSRSAYVGMALAALTAILLIVHGRKAKQRLAAVLAVLVIVGAGALVMLHNNSQFENTFFHTDETSASAISSNGQHASALRGALSDVAHEPFGRGPGTAGPASTHNNAPARIAENYYLQIGQETGWLGLALFVAIVAMVGRRLYALRADPLARTLLASLVGLSFINLALHAWTDDTLALLWWGFAGVAIAVAAPAILKPESKTSSKNT